MVLYFPQSQFSSRFGDNIFTFRIRDHITEGSDYSCGGKFTTYVIEVERGRSKWNVSRRYSEFAQMRSRLSQESSSALQGTGPLATRASYDKPDFNIPELPPKTCFRRFDDIFLRERQEALATFLHNVLQSASQRGVLGSDHEGHLLLEFLGFRSAP